MLVIVGGDYIKLPIDEILYFRADSKYIVAIAAKRSLKFEASLDSLEREYPQVLWRVHRKYLVKAAAVEELVKIDGGLFIDISGANEPIPVSRREASKVRELFRSGAST